MSLWINIRRVARYGLIGFVRNGFVSLASILIMTITLFVIAAMLIAGAALGSVLASLTDKVDVTIYFATDATPAQVTQVQQSLEALPEVEGTTYVSREDALAAFQTRHENDQLIVQALQELGDNPLGAELEVRAKRPDQYETIANYLKAQQTQGGAGASIDKVNFEQNQTAIARLSNIISTSRALGLVVGLVLAAASLLITFNTIRLAIYTARDEIGVMNLVGASPWYVRGPFMIAGVLYGAVSGLVVLLLLYPVTLSLGPGSEAFLGSFNVFSYYVDHFLFLFFSIIGAGAALGALSSFLAVRRYLHV